MHRSKINVFKNITRDYSLNSQWNDLKHSSFYFADSSGAVESQKTIKITIVYTIFNNKVKASEICALRRSREERVEEISGLRKLPARRLFLCRETLRDSFFNSALFLCSWIYLREILQKTSLNPKEQSPRWKFSESWNFLDSFFTRTSQRTNFGGPEFVIKYFINNSDFYCFLRLDGSARVSEIKWWMFQIISLWLERVIANYIFKNIDFWSMKKRCFLIFISRTICRMKKFQIRKRWTSTRRASTYFLFRIFMHFDFLFMIGKVLSSSSVASPYSIQALNLPRTGAGCHRWRPLINCLLTTIVIRLNEIRYCSIVAEISLEILAYHSLPKNQTRKIQKLQTKSVRTSSGLP